MKIHLMWAFGDGPQILQFPIVVVMIVWLLRKG